MAKLSAAGAAVQARRYGDDSAVPQVGRAVAGDGSGAVYAFGDFGGTVSFGGAPLTSAGSLDLFLVKLTP